MLPLERFLTNLSFIKFVPTSEINSLVTTNIFFFYRHNIPIKIAMILTFREI